MKPDSSMPFSGTPARHLPWVGFSITLLFLILIAVVADDVTTRLASDEKWVSHTQDVERVLGRLRGDLLAAESAQLLNLMEGTETRVEPYYSNSARIPQDIEALKALVSDNPSQEERVAVLRDMVNRRRGIERESLKLRNLGDSVDTPQENNLTLAGAAVSDQSMNIVQDMRSEEDRLLQQRQLISQHTYKTVRVILALAFGAAVIVLTANFRRLLIELRERKQAEESVRRMSGRILQVQDEERRKVARELHDSIGQVFAAMKMNLSMLGDGELRDPEKKMRLFSELQTLLDQGIAEARTLSHLLHPPLLDELGLASAARWLVDGFSQRSKIKVEFKLPETLGRMPAPIELALFRVLQESLTNIHRHSGSSGAEISLERTAFNVILTVIDHGKGIPEEILHGFRKSTGGLGVGLAGMRERVSELGGRLDLQADRSGTRLQVTLAVPAPEPAAVFHHRPPASVEVNRSQLS